MQNSKDSAVKASKGSKSDKAPKAKKSETPKKPEMIELAGVEKERKETAQQISGLKEQVTELQGGIEERDKEIGKLTTDRNTAKKTLGKIWGKNDSMASRMAKMEKIAADGDAEERLKQRELLKADVARAQTANAVLEKESKAKDGEISQLKKDLERVTRKLDAVEPTIQSMQNARDGAQDREKVALGQLDKLTAERDEALAKAKNLKTELTQLKEKAKQSEKPAAQPAK